MLCLYVWFFLGLSGAAISNLQEKQTDFGMRVFSQVAQNSKGSNLAFSPYGVATILGMAQLGAGGNTLKTMNAKLGFSLQERGMARQQRLLQRDISSEEGVELASGVMVERKMTLEKGFRRGLGKAFQASPHQLDFSRPDQARKPILASSAMAGEDEELVQSRKSRTLIIRHLPADLSRDEKQDLLKYFGAVGVRVFSDKGVLRHTAFATFASEKSAAKALSRLHQLQILNHTLVVEFAKDQEHVTVLKDPPVSDSATDGKDVKKKKEVTQPSIPLIETGTAPKLGLKFQSNPSLKYLYPPPSNGILTNITHALLSVPNFYVQVLHLMNKMNLPSPFGPITARPPMYEMHPAPPPPMPPPYPPQYPPLPADEMDLSSQEGSEYESGDDEDKERMIRLMGLVNQACKRPLRTKVSSKRKKPKFKDLLFVPKPDSQSAPGPILQPSDVFEQPQPCGQKKIEFHISADVSAILEGGGGNSTQQQEPTEEAEAAEEMQATTTTEEDPGEGFGKIYPAAQASQLEEDSDEDEDVPSDVISRKELDKGRLSRDEIKRMSVYKNYEPGEPTSRLYVKNIAKSVEEKDLKYIYGRYIDVSSEAERNMFDIVLMKEGRMKGQAFVGLPSERSAEKALRDTNGYVLFDKPLVVSFARSARPKADTPDPKKGPKRTR